jgi:hypothetical protein
MAFGGLRGYPHLSNGDYLTLVSEYRDTSLSPHASVISISEFISL